MPKISSFSGVSVFMYYNDHLPPHFQAKAEGLEILVDIRSGKVIRGTFPKQKQKLVLQWATQHRETLMQNWELARQNQPLIKI